jgi:hypothetical protein
LLPFFGDHKNGTPMQKTFSITEALNTLRIKRKLFASEADFQFALAWTIKELYPHVEVRLEWVPVDYDPNMYIDIVVLDDDKLIPIELKYKTKKTDRTVDGERFVLKDQSATDLGRYDFLKDIQRVEFVRQRFTNFKEGYAILLTNDPYYLVKPSKNANYAAFSVADGDIKTGALRWGEGSKSNTNRKGIDLLGEYSVKWGVYSRIDEAERVLQLVVPIRR